ncbi:arsenite methyltransferase [Acetobacterium sp.]|uniref:arsenite methyltransferase n=1 Tax=Acetobacterium sp. TaxID=1872094 RepID=UPI00359449CC
MSNKEEARAFIRENYAQVAQSGAAGGCCGGSCNCSDPMDIINATMTIGYDAGDLINAPPESNMGLGCGNPIAIASLKQGDVVLDLGSGGGFDCFLARGQVGATGYVIGVDMTPEMIKLARNNAAKSGYSNIEFRLGEIEHLPVADASIDVIISNCVINLSLEKEKVFKDAYRVLKSGGRLALSDVVATAELPETIKNDLAMVAGCVAGAEHMVEIRAMMIRAGFQNIKLMPKDNSKEILNNWLPDKKIEDYVASFIIEGDKM